MYDTILLLLAGLDEMMLNSLLFSTCCSLDIRCSRFLMLQSGVHC